MKRLFLDSIWFVTLTVACMFALSGCEPEESRGPAPSAEQPVIEPPAQIEQLPVKEIETGSGLAPTMPDSPDKLVVQDAPDTPDDEKPPGRRVRLKPYVGPCAFDKAYCKEAKEHAPAPDYVHVGVHDYGTCAGSDWDMCPREDGPVWHSSYTIDTTKLCKPGETYRCEQVRVGSECISSYSYHYCDRDE